MSLPKSTSTSKLQLRSAPLPAEDKTLSKRLISFHTKGALEDGCRLINFWAREVPSVSTNANHATRLGCPPVQRKSSSRLARPAINTTSQPTCGRTTPKITKRRKKHSLITSRIIAEISVRPARRGAAP